MSETKFTPGPWLFSSYKSGNSVIVIDGKEFDVATVNYPNRDANAHLIAAAPAMYAELQNIANADPKKWDEDTRDQFQQWAQSRARAALAKARGETE